MEFVPIKIKIEEPLECQACAGKVSNVLPSSTLTELFKSLTGIYPICADSDVVFCNNCESTLKAFHLFKNLCVQTQEIFNARYTGDDGSKVVEEFVVGIEVDEIIDPIEYEMVQHYICDLCQQEFKTKKNLRTHINNAHLKQRERTNEILYKCSDCNTILSSLRNLKRHQLTHNSEKSFECSYCESKFNSQQNLYYHERYVHRTGRQYVCSDCGYICYNPTVMNQHILRHHSMKKFRCDQCPKECKTSGDLRDHKRVHENLLKTVPCPECGTMFKHSKGMKTHFRSVHRAERKFICETCSKGFVSRCGLERHLVTHTGERKFPCTFCGQAFTQQQALKRHLTTHTGIRPFSCPHCSHTFAEKFYMKKHAVNCSKKIQDASIVNE